MALKYEYLGENETTFENVLTHWSVAQAGSNDEKICGPKISLDCPFKVLYTVYYYVLYVQTIKKIFFL